MLAVVFCMLLTWPSCSTTRHTMRCLYGRCRYGPRLSKRSNGMIVGCVGGEASGEIGGLRGAWQQSGRAGIMRRAGVEAWAWRRGRGGVDVEACTWRRGRGGVYVEAWTWRRCHGRRRPLSAAAVASLGAGRGLGSWLTAVDGRPRPRCARGFRSRTSSLHQVSLGLCEGELGTWGDPRPNDRCTCASPHSKPLAGIPRARSGRSHCPRARARACCDFVAGRRP